MLDLSWFFDFHSHKLAQIGQDPQPREVAQTLRSAGVEEVTFHAKCHVGFSYYPTEIGTRHPNLRGDVFGDLVLHCKAAGLKVFGYVSFGIDGEAGRNNPDWLKHLENGPHVWDDWFAYVCPFTGYTDSLLIPQAREILERYPVDGLWFDTMSAWNPCYCASCAREFREATKHELPRSPADPLWAPYGQFRHRRAVAMLQRVGREVREVRPGAVVGFNQVGSTPFPEALPEGITRLTLDFPTRGPQSRQASVCAAFSSTSPYEAEVIPTIMAGGWGDWSPAPAARLAQVAATTWARRIRLNAGDRLHPDGKLTAMTRDAVADIDARRRAWQPHFPPPEAKPIRDIVILHAATTQYGADKRQFGVDSKARLVPLQGICDLLLDAGAHYTVAAEYALDPLLDDARVVILPELTELSPHTDARLRAFLKRGGRVLAIGSTVPNVDGQAAAWPGLQSDPEPWHDHVYATVDDPERPVLLRGNVHRQRLRGAESVWPVRPPLAVRHGIRFGWGIAPPAEPDAEAPLLTRCAHGEGAAWFFGAPIGSDYHTMGSTTQVNLIRRILNMVDPLPRLRTSSDYGQVEVVGYQSDDACWAILVNHSGETLSATERWPRTPGPVIPLEVEVQVLLPAGKSCGEAAVDGVSAGVRVVDGIARVRLVVDEICKVVRIGVAARPAGGNRISKDARSERTVL